MTVFIFMAAIVVTLFEPVLQTAREWLGIQLGQHGITVQVSTILLLSALVWLVIIRLGGFRWVDLVNDSPFLYPPTWVVAVLGALGLAVTLHVQPFRVRLRFDDLDWIVADAVVVFPLGLLTACFIDWLTHKGHRSITKPDRVCSGDAEKAREWVAREAPIHHPSEDRFGYAPIARRMARILSQKESHTIGLVGPYGSGKTSLLNMMVHYLRTDATGTATNRLGYFLERRKTLFLKDRWHVCRMEAWGRDPSFFAGQVLRAAVSELGKQVDVLQLATLPSSYTAAMSGSGSSWGAILSHLLCANEDPVEQLRQMDDILAAARGRMVIIIEDLDRNSSDRFLKDELPALLDQLKQLERVSFVLAIGSERSAAQVMLRLCEHRENLS